MLIKAYLWITVYNSGFIPLIQKICYNPIKVANELI